MQLSFDLHSKRPLQFVCIILQEVANKVLFITLLNKKLYG